MTDTPQSVTLSHKIGWDLRAIAITMGCVAVALPFFVDEGAMGQGQSIVCMAGDRVGNARPLLPRDLQP